MNGFTLEASYLTRSAREWTRGQPAASILHLFDHVCNLIDDQGRILSLVSPDIGPGPFSIVVPITRSFLTYADSEAVVLVRHGRITLRSLVIDTAAARLWDPRPDWGRLQKVVASRLETVAALFQCLESEPDPPTTLASNIRERLVSAAGLLQRGLAKDDVALCRQAARQMAGLGSGLTPDGDDFLMGAIYGLWATRPADAAAKLAGVMAGAAAPHTVALSAAWLNAAAHGEAAEPWHELVNGLIGEDRPAVRQAVGRIMDTGHTSGYWALEGFTTIVAGSRPPA